MSWLTAIDPRIWQALIAGVFLAVGWIVNGRQNRAEARRLKAEKMRDYHKAIYAEIRNSIAVFWDDGKARRHAAGLVKSMRADPSFRPFIAHERHDLVYEAILGEIETLPRSTIDLVVAYYGQVASMTALARDLRNPEALRGADVPVSPRRGRRRTSTRQNQTRLIRLYLDYFHTRERAYLQGLDTLDVIRAFADGGPDAAEQRVLEINNRDADRRDRQQGSA
ncbi:hypothetical protein [Hasllibacter sp. MH4015]|uniref:hypothetical protein n=1 Tax=Hasllibacter sp. MH4015 TaxID=2854029 RepID=UPI001CD3F5F2|nr:hypothetical protein [Hasllibacter sp. MH4015]